MHKVCSAVENQNEARTEKRVGVAQKEGNGEEATVCGNCSKLSLHCSNASATATVSTHSLIIITLSLSLPLLGLEADLFYVHEGAINTYAMHFTVPVPADVHELEFSWQSLIAYPVSYHRLCYRSSLPFISNLICTPLTDYPTPSRCRLQLRYTISIEYATEQDALGTPTLSIPHKGLVPQEIESFLVYLPCTGNASLQLPVNVNMVVQGPPRFNDTRLHFKRNKICAKGKSSTLSHSAPPALPLLSP